MLGRRIRRGFLGVKVLVHRVHHVGVHGLPHAGKCRLISIAVVYWAEQPIVQEASSEVEAVRGGQEPVGSCWQEEAVTSLYILLC